MPFPYFTKEQLRQHYPSKAQGRSWEQEIGYRNECIAIITKTSDGLHLPTHIKEKAVIILHRFFTCKSSLEFVKMEKWAMATACVFLASKIDSAYHRLDSVVHSAIVELRRFQNRSMEREYFNADGTGGNPAYLDKLSDMVRRAEVELLFALNFDFNISAPSTVAALQLRELGLTETAEQEFPELAAKIAAVRAEAVVTANQSVMKPGTFVCLLQPPENIALAAIYRACRANRLQWYLKPQPQDLVQTEEGQTSIGRVSMVPNLTTEQLQVIEKLLPTKNPEGFVQSGSSIRSSAAEKTTPGDCSFRKRGWHWAAGKPAKGIMRKQPGSAADSGDDVATPGPHIGVDPSPSPDSAAGGSQQNRHLTFAELPPSIKKSKARQQGQQQVPHDQDMQEAMSQPEQKQQHDVQQQVQQPQQPMLPQQPQHLPLLGTKRRRDIAPAGSSDDVSPRKAACHGSHASSHAVPQISSAMVVVCGMSSGGSVKVMS